MSVFTFTKNLISSFNYIENVDELKNHIIIEGEEYSIYDELHRILDGTEIMYTLDDVPDGDSYGRMALTSISAGKVIIAGCDAEVTDQMFTSPAAKTNIEAWMKAGDTTFIDGGFIYTSSVVVAGLNVAVTNRMFGTDAIKTNIEAWRHAGNLTLIDGGDIYTKSIVADAIAAKTLTLGEVADDAFMEEAYYNLIRNSVFNYDGQALADPAFWDITSAGAFDQKATYAAPEAHKKYPWDYVYYAHQTAVQNDGNGAVQLKGTEYIPVNREEPYTLSIWIKKHGTVTKWHLGLFFYDSDKVACAPVDLDYPASMDGITTTTTTYTRYSGTFGPDADDYDIAFPDDCAYVKILFLPLYLPAAGDLVGSMATGLQFEPGDKLTNWKPWRADYNESVLDIWQGEDDTQVFRMRSKSIDHDITQGGGLGYDWGTHTDCFFYMRKKDVDLGGVHCNSFTEATQDISYELYAIYGDANNAKDGNANGPINFAALRADPANHSYQACENNDNLFVLKTKPFGGVYQAVHIWDEDGNYYQDGVTAAFQGHDDIALLREVEDILGSRISKESMMEKDVFKKHGIINVSEVDEEEIDGNTTRKTGRTRLDRFVNTKKWSMLHTGAIIQLDEKIESEIQQLTERIDELEARLN